MTEETERPANGRESSTRPGSPAGDGATPSVYYSAARHGQHVEESPDLLRWRADLLMDEMMMGGVDASAADPTTRTFSGVDSTASYSSGRNGGDGAGGYESDPRTRPAARVDAPPARRGPLHPDDKEAAADRSGEYRSQDRYERDTNGRAPHDAHPEPNGARLRGPEDRAGNGERHANGDLTHDELRHWDVGLHADNLVTPPTRRTPPPYSAAPGEEGAGPARPRHDSPASDPHYERYTPDGDRARTDYGFDEEPQTRPEPPSRDRRLDLPSTPPRTHLDVSPVSGDAETAPRSDRLYTLEQRYAQLRREQADKIEPVPVTPASPPPASFPPAGPRPARPAPVDPDDPTQWAVGPEKWNWQDFSAQPGEEPEPEEPVLTGRFAVMDRDPLADSPAVRQDPSQFVNSMAVFDSKKKRSTLLPRMSELDADTLHREISSLHGELSHLLPVGNETGERARHLLDKAYTILQSDPMRSAEVEYYMQQVRTIVARLHQARQWSDLYRSRLNVYLWAWFGLSLVLLMSRFIFQEDFDSFLTIGFGLSSQNFLVQHWATFWGTTFAGALGGAVGALYTMRVHARTEYGFFDRKYGLRGLILPVIGLLVGGVGYWIFGLVYAVAGINPAQNLVAGIIPALAALGFGLSQETIYGTRG